MKKFNLLLLAILLIAACKPTLDIKEEANISALEYQAQSAFGAWDNATAQLKSPDKTTHDTWLSFGIRYQYAALKNVVNLGKIQEASGMKVFASGPHDKDVNFNGDNFGYYNADFLKASNKMFKKAFTKAPLRSTTERVYNSQLKNLARVYHDTYKYLKTNPSIPPNYAHEKGKNITLGMVKETYLAKIKSNDRPGNYLQSAFHHLAEEKGGNGDNWYNYNVAAGFWVRRMIDGTDDEFLTLLETMMNEFDKEGMKE